MVIPSFLGFILLYQPWKNGRLWIINTRDVTPHRYTRVVSISLGLHHKCLWFTQGHFFWYNTNKPQKRMFNCVSILLSCFYKFFVRISKVSSIIMYILPVGQGECGCNVKLREQFCNMYTLYSQGKVWLFWMIQYRTVQCKIIISSWYHSHVVDIKLIYGCYRSI